MLKLQHVDLGNNPAASVYIKDETVEAVFATKSGQLLSREGPNRYDLGDALVTSSAGDCWSVSRDRFQARYVPVPPLSMGENGKYRAQPLPVLAMQIAEVFCIARRAGGDLLRGEAGDWLLQYAPGDFGVIEEDRFAKVYKRQATVAHEGKQLAARS